MPPTRLTPAQLVHQTLEHVLKGIERGDLSHVEERLHALVDQASRSGAPPAQVFKVDIERRMVYGWASVSSVGGEEITDKQNDVLSIDDLREAAHAFIGKRVVGDMHQRLEDIGEVRESLVFDKGLQDVLGIDLGMEGWFVGAYVKDQGTWDRVRKGELKAFSIGGTGQREPMELVTKARRALAKAAGRTPAGQVALFREALTAIQNTQRRTA